jgi:hypothetical protein
LIGEKAEKGLDPTRICGERIPRESSMRLKGQPRKA